MIDNLKVLNWIEKYKDIGEDFFKWDWFKEALIKGELDAEACDRCISCIQCIYYADENGCRLTFGCKDFVDFKPKHQFCKYCGRKL